MSQLWQRLVILDRGGVILLMVCLGIAIRRKLRRDVVLLNLGVLKHWGITLLDMRRLNMLLLDMLPVDVLLRLNELLRDGHIAPRRVLVHIMPLCSILRLVLKAGSASVCSWLSRQ